MMCELTAASRQNKQRFDSLTLQNKALRPDEVGELSSSLSALSPGKRS